MNKKIMFTVAIPVISGAILLFLLLTGILQNLIGADGFYGGLVVLSWLMFIYPAVIIIPAILSAIVVKESRMKAFIKTLAVAIVVNILFFGILSLVGNTKNETSVNEMYAENPQSRPLLDPERPLTIIQPWLSETVTSPIEIEVYVHTDEATFEHTVTTELVSDLNPTILPIQNIELEDTNKLAPDGSGRRIFTGTIEFSNQDLSSGKYYLVVQTNEGLVDIREVSL